VRDCRGDVTEREEPKAGNNLSRSVLLTVGNLVVTDETEASEGDFALILNSGLRASWPTAVSLKLSLFLLRAASAQK